MAKILYTVQSGDSLSKIAQDKLGEMERWKELAYINSLSHPYIIMPGQILLLPDDDDELMIDITDGVTAPESPIAAPVKSAGFQLSPATALVLLAVAAFLFLGKGK